jgi:hypothetical protein
MRTHLLTVAVCLFAGISVAAAQPAVQGGIFGGPGATTLTPSSDGAVPDFKTKGGMAIGGFLVAPVAPAIAIEPEVLYSIRRSAVAVGSSESTFTFTALEFPVLFRLAAAASGAGLHLLAGPTFNLRLTASQTTTGPGGTQHEDAGDQAARGEFGMIVGGGVDVGRLRLDGRYTWGLSSLNTDTSENTHLESRAFTFLAGFRLW